MAKNDEPTYPVGYRKPPRRTQFRPGQSGNRNGRPKKTKTLVDVLMKELLARVTITVHGKRKTVSMLEAMLKQHINKAASGDAKAVALILNLLRFHNYDEGDNLSAVVQQFRAIHESHMAADPDRTQATNDDEPSGEDKQ